MTEEQEGDGDEAFADYEGDRITFGNNVEKEKNDKKLHQIRESLADAQMDNGEDQELEAWEREKMKNSRPRQPALNSNGDPVLTILEAASQSSDIL